MLTAQLLRPAGTGAHLSTSGVEFDEKILRLGPDCALRRGVPRDVHVRSFAFTCIPRSSERRPSPAEVCVCAPHAWLVHIWRFAVKRWCSGFF